MSDDKRNRTAFPRKTLCVRCERPPRRPAQRAWPKPDAPLRRRVHAP